MWELNWAFILNEERAASEAYNASTAGTFNISEAYPGCPNCGKDTVMKCHKCGGITCLTSTAKVGGCAWCNESGRIAGGIASIRTGET